MTSDGAHRRIPLATHFTFQAKVFATPGVYFTRDDASDDPVFHVPLGDVVARVPAPAVCREFHIEAGSSDRDLLDLVARALAHVAEVRPGDSVPTEIIDGAASWRFDPAHHLIARGRLFAHLLAWATGVPNPIPPRDGLLVFEDSENFIARGEAALAKAAAAAGVGLDDARRRFDDVAREAAYVEALRDHYAGLFRLPRKFAAARARVEGDQIRREEFDRIAALVERPLAAARRAFTAAERAVADPVGLVRAAPEAIRAVRRSRDRLHADTRSWREITPMWEEDRADDEDARRARTYHLLASRFAEGAAWTPAA